MAEPTGQRPSPANPAGAGQQALIATSYGRAAFWMAAIALGISGMAAGPALLGGLRPSVLDRLVIATWLILGITSLSEIVLLPRAQLTRLQVIAGITSSAGALIMIIGQVGKGWVAGVAFVLATTLMVIGLVASARHNRAAMARLRAASSTRA